MEYEENYSLQIESSFNPQYELGKVISHLFSNDYIYAHCSFRKLIQEDRKGYIEMRQLLKNQSIQKYFEHIDIQEQEHQLIFIKSTIQYYCLQLHYHHQRVRRIDPWKKNIGKSIKPFSISKLKSILNISDVRQHLNNHCFTTNQSMKPKQQFIYLYSQNHVQMQESQENPFQIVSYSQLCRQKARRSKAWISQEQRNYRPLQYYPKSFWEYCRQYLNLNEQNEQEYHSYQDESGSIQKDNFRKIVKNPSLALNEMLRGYMHKSEQEDK